MASGDTINAAFPYFDEDFRRDTFHLSDREKLIYKSALCYVWKHGFIPADPQAFALVTYANGTRKWRECVANVQRMMRTCADHPDRLTHPRVEEDRANYLAQRAKTRQRKRALDSRKSEVTRYDRVPSSFTSSSSLKSPSSNNENPKVRSGPERARARKATRANGHAVAPVTNGTKGTEGTGPDQGLSEIFRALLTEAGVRFQPLSDDAKNLAAWAKLGVTHDGLREWLEWKLEDLDERGHDPPHTIRYVDADIRQAAAGELKDDEPDPKGNWLPQWIADEKARIKARETEEPDG